MASQNFWSSVATYKCEYCGLEFGPGMKLFLLSLRPLKLAHTECAFKRLREKEADRSNITRISRD